MFKYLNIVIKLNYFSFRGFYSRKFIHDFYARKFFLNS
jgi:hypothetical protein